MRRALALTLTLALAWALPAPFDRLEGGEVPLLRDLALRGEGFPSLLAGALLWDREEIPLYERAEYAWRYAVFLEEVQAFEPGWEARPAWARAAPLLLAIGDRRAVSAYRRLLPAPEAVEALKGLLAGDELYQALFEGRAYGALLELLPSGARPDLWAQALYRLGRYQEALPHYQAWARAQGGRAYLGLGWTLMALGRHGEARRAFAQYPGPEGAYGQARALEALGRTEEALAWYRASTPSGLWRATGLLERRGRLGEALPLYLRLARTGTVYAEPAALRAYLLGGPEERGEVRPWLGGLAYLVGLPLPVPPSAPLAPPPPEAPLVEALQEAGRAAWARGVVRYALWQRPRDWPALVPLLYRTGAYREGIRAAWPTALAYPRAYRDWIEVFAQAEGLDQDLLYALVHAESRFDPLAVSPTGARGLGQFTRATWEDVARMLGEAPGDPFDPRTNLRYTARYLRWLLERCQALGLSEPQRTACALTAYNGGIGYLTRGLAREGDFFAFLRFQERDEPRTYLARVLGAYGAYRALP